MDLILKFSLKKVSFKKKKKNWIVQRNRKEQQKTKTHN